MPDEKPANPDTEEINKRITTLERQLHALRDRLLQDEHRFITRMIAMIAVYFGLICCGGAVVAYGASEQIPYALVGLAICGTVFTALLLADSKPQDNE